MSAETSTGLRLPDRRAQLELGLWSSVVALTTLDVATTTAALAVGLPEANPMLAGLLHSAGPLALLPVKAVYLALALAVWRHVEPARWRPHVLALAAVIGAAVVVNNVAWILMAGGL